MVVVANSGVGVRVKILKRVEKKDMHVGAVSSSQDSETLHVEFSFTDFQLPYSGNLDTS